MSWLKPHGKEKLLAAEHNWRRLCIFHLHTWLNTDALLDELKEIKSIMYTKQEAQTSRAGSTNWSLEAGKVAVVRERVQEPG